MTIREIARYLRIRQTPEEKVLWEYVRNRKIAGKKFLRQHPIVFFIGGEKRFFIADFYCAECRVVVEIDGKVHDRMKDHDALRDWIMFELGYRVVRFTNDDINNRCHEIITKLKELVT